MRWATSAFGTSIGEHGAAHADRRDNEDLCVLWLVLGTSAYASTAAVPRDGHGTARGDSADRRAKPRPASNGKGVRGRPPSKVQRSLEHPRPHGQARRPRGRPQRMVRLPVGKGLGMPEIKSSDELSFDTRNTDR